MIHRYTQTVNMIHRYTQTVNMYGRIYVLTLEHLHLFSHLNESNDACKD